MDFFFAFLKSDPDVRHLLHFLPPRAVVAVGDGRGSSARKAWPHLVNWQRASGSPAFVAGEGPAVNDDLLRTVARLARAADLRFQGPYRTLSTYGQNLRFKVEEYANSPISDT